MSLFPDNLSQRERSMSYQDSQDADAAWKHEQAVNAACAAIRRTPIEFVNPEFVGRVLCTLASRVNDASKVYTGTNLAQIGEHIEAVADEVEGLS